MSKNPRKFRQPVRLIVSIEAQTMNTIVRLPESPEITYHYQAGPCHSLVVSVQSAER